MPEPKQCLYHPHRKCIAPDTSIGRCAGCWGTHMFFILNSFLKVIEGTKVDFKKCYMVYAVVTDFRNTEQVFVNWMREHYPDCLPEIQKKVSKIEKEIRKKVDLYRA